ncbi:MAG TPA: hypothetical protein VMV45_10570 [Casimicrobiaceae bacterium]|nr:hypothetical protein [Casimicrobiaceae bacterium]
MSAAGARSPLFHLGWRANGDSLDVALAANRLRAAGSRAWWLRNRHDHADAGDYLVELSAGQIDALAHLGLSMFPWHDDIPTDAVAVARPQVRLFAGTASKYPYFAYYSLCLLRLGIDYLPCDGAALAGGALDDADLLILPGGFATWGIDAAEDAPGADRCVRAFLARGGGAIGSCGGAFYLSAGRPGWTGTAAAKPLYTHEYLQSGVGVVAIAMRPGPLSLGCPPTMEVPYYHGPIYDLVGEGVEVAATFQALTMSGRLAIDNPLDRARFDRDMAGKPAILTAAGDRGAAVLFSPHPEMGDLVRKYIALDGYVRHYLPIRGFATLRDTLRHYRVADAPCFRLVHNAIQALMMGIGASARADACTKSSRSSAAVAAQQFPARAPGAADLRSLCGRAVSALPELPADDEGELLRDVARGIAQRLDRMEKRAIFAMHNTPEDSNLMPSRRHLEATMADHMRHATHRTVTQQLMEADLAVALLECWTRAVELDRAIAGAA